MAVTDGTVGRSAYLREAELRWAGLSLGVSVGLVAIKFAAYFLTHSDAVFSDALENIANVLTAGFGLYSIRMAHRPRMTTIRTGMGKSNFSPPGWKAR